MYPLAFRCLVDVTGIGHYLAVRANYGAAKSMRGAFYPKT